MQEEIILGDKLIRYEEEIKKSRILIVKNNQVLLANYAGIYLLPGGGLEYNETHEMALYREIKEEVGTSICDNYSLDNIRPLVDLTYYQENFPSRKNVIENRVVKTRYYYLFVDDKFAIKGNTLSDSEKENNFYLKFYDIEIIDKLLVSNNTLNPRKEYFNKELLIILDYFKKHVCKQKIYKKIK